MARLVDEGTWEGMERRDRLSMAVVDGGFHSVSRENYKTSWMKYV